MGRFDIAKGTQKIPPKKAEPSVKVVGRHRPEVPVSEVQIPQSSNLQIRGPMGYTVAIPVRGLEITHSGRLVTIVMGESAARDLMDDVARGRQVALERRGGL
jgi:hypothetical protein